MLTTSVKTKKLYYYIDITCWFISIPFMLTKPNPKSASF